MYAIVESVRTPELLWNRLSTGQGAGFVGEPVPHRIESQGPLDRHAHHEHPHHESRPTGEQARVRTSG
jgi:hypothetical protein